MYFLNIQNALYGTINETNKPSSVHYKKLIEGNVELKEYN